MWCYFNVLIFFQKHFISFFLRIKHIFILVCYTFPCTYFENIIFITTTKELAPPKYNKQVVISCNLNLYNCFNSFNFKQLY